jgi:hypothetical protein
MKKQALENMQRALLSANQINIHQINSMKPKELEKKYLAWMNKLDTHLGSNRIEADGTLG